MSAEAWLLACLVVCGVGFGVGLGVGLRIAARKVEETIDRYERITDTPNRRGEGHNWHAAPSVVSKAHIRNRRYLKHH